MKLNISKSEARHIILEAQGLLSQISYGKESETITKLIEKLTYVQIDTISVVERAHHHVFWSRNPKYQKKDLDKAVNQKSIFEYWSHAAAYLPISEFRFCLPRMKYYASSKKHWFPSDEKVMKHVMKRIKTEGPLKSSDFEREDGAKGGPWWDWKPAKQALELLFHAGKLMVLRRDGFQKVYCLTEDFLSSDIDTSEPTQEEYARHLVLQSLKSQGLATSKQIGYQNKIIKHNQLNHTLKDLAKDGKITEIKIENLDEKYYLLANTAPPRKTAENLHILSPFDNLVIQRERLRSLFDFDYQIECYLPPAKRKYGYFTLPILYGEKFIGRIDCKARRKEKILEIINISLEPKVQLTNQLKKMFRTKLDTFAKFNLCSKVKGLNCEMYL